MTTQQRQTDGHRRDTQVDAFWTTVALTAGALAGVILFATLHL